MGWMFALWEASHHGQKLQRVDGRCGSGAPGDAGSCTIRRGARWLHGAPSFVHSHLSAHSPARVSPEHGIVYKRPRDRAVLVPASNQQKWGLCFLPLRSQRMLAAHGDASSTH